MTGRLGILSLNIYHGALQKELLAYIGHKLAHTDIFCFQEADPAIVEQLDELLIGEFSAYYAYKENDADDYHLATYVRRNLQVVRNREVLAGVGSVGLGLACTVRTSGDKELTITSVHGNSQPGHKLDTPDRLVQSGQLIESSNTSNGTSVFIGDFNLLPGTESVDMFVKSGYRNLINEYNIATTRNEIAWRRYPENKQLYADYAFIRGGSGVVYDFTVEPIDVSDHLPLLLQVKIT